MNFRYLVTFITFSICSCSNDENKQSVSEKTEFGYKPTLTIQEDIRASFDKLPPLKDKIKGATKLTIFEGLPHPTWERKLLKEELENKITISRFDFHFYKNSYEISAEDTKKIQLLINEVKTFQRYYKQRNCGGFHPDFSLVWNNGGDEVEMHLCYGCGEMKAFNNDVEVYCYVRSESLSDLMKILSKYQKQRPKK